MPVGWVPTVVVDGLDLRRNAHVPHGSERRPAVRIFVTTVDPRADLSALHGPDGSGVKFLVGQYVSLMKPRIIELLLITTIPVMFLADRGVPDLWLVVATVVGGTLVRRRGQHPQLLHRPRHRRGHAPHEQASARHRHGEPGAAPSSSVWR